MVTDHHRIMKNTKKKERKLLSFSHLEIIFSSLTNLLANRNPFIYCRWWLLTSPMMMMIMMVVIFESIFFYLKKSMVIIGSKKKSNIWFNLKVFFPINQMIETSYSNDISVVCLSVLVQNVRRGMKKQGQTVIWFFDLIRDW